MKRAPFKLQRNRAIAEAHDDALGIQDLAEQVARLCDPKDDHDSLILGIEAEWGAGKSSLIELTRAEIEKAYTNEFVVVEFSPWLIGSREELMRQFFDTLVEAIAHSNFSLGDARGVTGEAAKKAIEGLRAFARRVGPLSGIARVAGDLGVPLVGLAAPTLEALQSASEANVPDKSLEKIKEQIEDSVTKLGKRFLIVIDDLDRLEPREILEIFRLIRAVLDIKQFTYVLCYDKEIIWNALSQTFGEREARFYLEKIIRLEIGVPEPEESSLRSLFEEALRSVVPEISAVQEGEIYSIFQEWGRRYLRTPRAINRVCDNISFLWAGGGGKLYLPDLVWLSILKIGSPKYYKFVEKYLRTWAFFNSDGGNLSKGEAEKYEEIFDSIAEEEGFDRTMELIMIDRFLPGINKFPSTEGAGRFLKRESLDGKIESERRLASLDYGRSYFALQPASFAPAETLVEGFVEVLRGTDKDAIAAGIRDALDRQDPFVFLEILKRASFRVQGGIAIDSCSIFEALCMVGADLYRLVPKESWHRALVWSHFEEILYSGGTISDRRRIKSAVRDVSDPSWIADIVAEEKRRENKGYPLERLFEDEQRDWVVDITISRIAEFSVMDLANAARPEAIWFFWLFADKDGLRDYLRRKTRKNQDLLAFLGSFWTRSSGGRDYIVKADLAPIIDVDIVEKRVCRMMKASGEVRKSAAAIARRLVGWENDAFGEEP